MNFYLAASRTRRVVAARVIAELERRGHKCTHNWTKQEVWNQGFSDPEAAAKKCFRGISDANHFIALLPAPTAGANNEIGFGLAMGFRVQLIELHSVGENSPSVFDPSEGNIFYSLADSRLQSDLTWEEVEYDDLLLGELAMLIEGCWG